MKIKYLGTAASEGVPSLFCNCRVCKESIKKGGRNLRSRSQALINDDLLLDFPPDTAWHTQRYSLDWEKIGDILFTHSHPDHLYPEDIALSRPGFAAKVRLFRFYATDDGYRKLSSFMNQEEMKDRAKAIHIEPGKPFSVGENGKYHILPLWADHDPSTDPVIYSIASEGKRMLYAHDTGIFPEETFAALKKEGRYDFLSLDCTGCLGQEERWRNGHMSLWTNLEILDRMRGEGIIDENTIVAASHFSHNGQKTYDELAEAAEKYNILIAYDGMEVEF